MPPASAPAATLATSTAVPFSSFGGRLMGASAGAETTSTSGRTISTCASFVHGQVTPIELGSMHALDGSLRLRIRAELDEPKAPRPPAHLVEDDRGGHDLAKSLERCSELLLGGRIRQISYV